MKREAVFVFRRALGRRGDTLRRPCASAIGRRHSGVTARDGACRADERTTSGRPRALPARQASADDDERAADRHGACPGPVTRAERQPVASGCEAGRAVEVEDRGLRAEDRAEAGGDDALAAREAVAGDGRRWPSRRWPEEQLAGLLRLPGLPALHLPRGGRRRVALVALRPGAVRVARGAGRAAPPAAPWVPSVRLDPFGRSGPVGPEGPASRCCSGGALRVLGLVDRRTGRPGGLLARCAGAARLAFEATLRRMPSAPSAGSGSAGVPGFGLRANEMAARGALRRRRSCRKKSGVN